MEIGSPKRIVECDPIRDPIPDREPTKLPLPAPQPQPSPTKEPAKVHVVVTVNGQELGEWITKYGS